MIKLKEPLHLNSLNQLNRWNDSFENEILGKYELFPMSFHSEELLHLLKGEQEQTDVPGMMQLIYNETYNENITLHVGILNQFINRMLALMEHRYTYNDYIYVSGFLTKVGISNTTEFLENTYNYLRETKLVSDSVHMEEQNQNILSYVYNQLAEYNRSKETRQEQPAVSEKEFAIQNLKYVNHILNRVGVKQHLQTVRKFRESTNAVNDYSESAFYMELQNLTDLNELNYQTIVKTYALNGVTYCHINPYELPQEEKDAMFAEKISGSGHENSAEKKESVVRNTFTNMVAAALCNITDSVYKAHITQTHGEEKNFHSEIILDGADWSQMVYESSVRYVNNLLSNRNQWYFSLLRNQVYESGKNRLQLLDRMIHSVKVMKQKEVFEVREQNQIQRIKETIAAQEKMQSVLEQYTEQIEMQENELHTMQTKMSENSGRIEVVEQTILSETEHHNAEQKLMQMIRKPSVSKIRKAVLQSFLGQEETNKNIADVYVEADVAQQEDRQEEKLEYTPASELSEETREIFSLVQEYLLNPETVSNSGKISADVAAMLHYDIHNQSELSVEEYRSYQERIAEKTETEVKKVAEESVKEAFSLVQEYRNNTEKVSDSDNINETAAAMLHYDIYKQSELSIEEYHSYQERIAEKTEKAARKVAEESVKEAVSLVREYLENSETVSNFNKISVDAGTMHHYDIHNQSELNAEVYRFYQEKIAEKTEKAARKVAEESVKEAFSLVQEYLKNPKTISKYGKISTDVATMLHYVQKLSELSEEEYLSYQEKITEKSEPVERSVSEKSDSEVISAMQEYWMNPGIVLQYGEISSEAATIFHSDIHNQTELDVEEPELQFYHEKIAEETETATRRVAEESIREVFSLVQEYLKNPETVSSNFGKISTDAYRSYQEIIIEKEAGLPEIVLNEWGPYVEAYLKEQYSVSAPAVELANRENLLAQQEVKLLYNPLSTSEAEIVYQRGNYLEELAELWNGTDVSCNLTEILQQHSDLFYDNREHQEYQYTEQINHMYSVIQHGENLTREENRQITTWLQLLNESEDNRITEEDRTVINQFLLNQMETVQKKQQLCEIIKKYETILVNHRIQQNHDYREQYEQVWNTVHNIQNMSWPEQKNLSVILEYIREDGTNITESEQVLLQKTLDKIQVDRIYHTEEVRQLLEREILEQVYTEQGAYAGDIKLYVNNLTQEGSLLYVYSQETENQYRNSTENQYQNNFGSNTSYNKTVNQSVQWNESSINTESTNTLQMEQQNTVVSQSGRDLIKQTQNSSTERMERERIRTEMEHILEKQINNISEKVYSKLERKLSSERKRRGY